MRRVTSINIKSCAYFFFNDIINIKNKNEKYGQQYGKNMFKEYMKEYLKEYRKNNPGMC